MKMCTMAILAHHEPWSELVQVLAGAGVAGALLAALVMVPRELII